MFLGSPAETTETLADAPKRDSLDMTIWKRTRFPKIRGQEAADQRSFARPRLEQALVPQPVGTRLRPGGVWSVTWADAKVMGSRRIDM